MPVPTSNISMSAINAEVSSVNSGSLRTLSANAIPAKSAPDGMGEFAGYTHTQNFGTPSYIRYYDSNLTAQSFNSSTNPYAAMQSTVSASTSNITCYTQATVTDDYFAQAYAGVDFRVRRSSSYYFLETRHFGLGIVTPRYHYREGNQVQTVSSTNVGGNDQSVFLPIMRIQPSVNPGGLQVKIHGGASTTSNNGVSGGSGGISTLSGATSGFSTYGYNSFHTLNQNDFSVGVRWYTRAQTNSYSNSLYNHTGTQILKVTIRATGYYDQEIGSIMPQGVASVRNVYPSCFTCCVHDSMLVSTKEDMKSIYDIEIGDMIVSHNFETGQDEVVPVTDKIIVDRDVDYKINNLIMTEDHPVYLEGGRKASVNPEATKINYKQIVDQLQIGDKMITLDGLEEITSIEKYKGNHKNFALQTEHNNFYANGHLVDSVIDRGEN